MIVRDTIFGTMVRIEFIAFQNKRILWSKSNKVTVNQSILDFHKSYKNVRVTWKTVQMSLSCFNGDSISCVEPKGLRMSVMVTQRQDCSCNSDMDMSVYS